MTGTEVGDPTTTAASKEVDAAANLVAIGLVLLFVAAIVWAVTRGPSVEVLPFGGGALPLDLGLLIAAAGLVCLVGVVVMLLRAD